MTLLAAGILLGIVLYEGNREAERQAEADASQLVLGLESRLGSVFRRAQSALEELSAYLPREALRDGDGRYEAMVTRMLAARASHFPEIVGLRVLDAQGKARYASENPFQSASAGDREYFAELRASPERMLVFSGAIDGRISGRKILVMAMPLRAPDGEFLGAVIAPIDLGVIEQLFASLGQGAGAVASLRRIDNGSLALRLSAAQATTGEVQPDLPLLKRIKAGELSGVVRLESEQDKTKRLFAYRQVDKYPFYLAAGIAAEDYLAAWKKMAMMASLAAALLVLALTLGFIRLLRTQREEAQIGRRLSESEARYRLLAENSHDVIWTLDIPSRKFTYISPSVEQLRGYTVVEALQQTLDETLTPESAQAASREIDQRLRRIAAGDQAARVVASEVDQRCKGGGFVTTEIVSTCLLDDQGVPQTLLGITRNISERKAAELALRDSNDRLQAQLDEIGRLQGALRELAIRDGLTGLYNRRYLDETLEREVSRARREGSPLSLVMLDIDYFKRINDTYGHQVGDEVLKILARTLVANTRTEDVACRYGGEEFLILLPNMPLAAAMARAETWRQEVEALCVMHGNFVIRFTISLGVASYPEHGKIPDELTRCVDQSLYAAKRSGRNRVALHQPVRRPDAD